MKKQLTIEIIKAFLIVLFLYAAISKLVEIHDFQQELSKSPMLHAVAKLLAIGVPSIELFICSLLLYSKTSHTGFILSLFLLTSFTAYLIITINYSTYVPCSCGGVISQLSWNQHILLNFFFILLSITGILLSASLRKSLV
ncbi:hypothetical protein C3K47_11010 [Solitalea longa]|uniref:Methylamine utilisation protein MauE domain-containing protein n=1 Tax=Solitalea longa TaxID=2079460 RepID=A0A2S5A1X5_9SPHI|nr:MauE/DoxX family redox-associated membrane protein [Solitalea longa]POY36277.1 hypothetical protein C3K47_11010 [Solitalea longa]